MATVIPILRIFDYAKALEFYVNWLGFHIDWEHKPEHAPVVLQVSYQDIILQLSEHHGDGAPGVHVAIRDFVGLQTYHQELLAKNYKYNRPGIESPYWDPEQLEVTVIDPFGNRLTFSEKMIDQMR